MVDGAQGAVHFPADVQQLDIVSMLFQVTNCMVRQASAVLYGKPELLEAMSPWLGGRQNGSRSEF